MFKGHFISEIAPTIMWPSADCLGWICYKQLGTESPAIACLDAFRVFEAYVETAGEEGTLIDLNILIKYMTDLVIIEVELGTFENKMREVSN